VLRILNPVVKGLLRTPLAKALPFVAMLEFTGRRSGRRIRVAVGFHAIDGGNLVFTPAPWRANFAGGHPVTVWNRGKRDRVVGTLESDPTTVADAIRGVLDANTSPRALGLAIPEGHVLTPADVSVMNRAMVRFRPTDPAALEVA
jgi:hypothetical protein